MKKITALMAALMLTGCTANMTYKDFEKPAQPESTLSSTEDVYVEKLAVYEDAGIPDKCLETVSSDDGICTISKMEHYYDVHIDYEHSDPAQAGRAYAQAVMKIYPDISEMIEPYLYENIMIAFPAVKDYAPVEKRIFTLAESLHDDQKEELFAFAEEISGGVRGYEQDGKISYEEAVTFSLIPEALRESACSALTLWGSKTATGDMIATRFLDWNLGSDYQMCKIHAIIHADKGERSYTAISFLGLGSIISGVNNDGVFAAILDVGSYDQTYSCEDRKCYTWELRYALEEYDTAKEVGQYMVDNSADFTWSHHIYLADGKETYCAEDAAAQLQKSGKGFSVLRDSDTPLMDAIHWDNPDSLCVVNSFAAKGNQDGFSTIQHNTVRFNKYNEWVGSRDTFTAAQLKSVLTSEQVNLGSKENEPQVNCIRNRGTSQIIMVDYHTGNIQVAFTPAEGPSDDVVFTDIGHY
ncbi:MAG: hypothetical protein II782_07790 [Oscillospiraceae bacterium]|nr:hypothetical protein [Oscillospiraceae bacterium]